MSRTQTTVTCPNCDTETPVADSYGRWECRECGWLLRDNEVDNTEGMFQ